jgi:hypothetical protein
MKWLLRIVLLVVVLYATLFGVVFTAMHQSPVRFGQFMKHMPPILVWGALPAKSMWLNARQGTLSVGDSAPDFTLPTKDRKTTVTLSAHRGVRPVVLVFGSYT